MTDTRVQYGIDNFLQEGFFITAGQEYLLEETQESGKSALTVYVSGENLCGKDFDHKGKCNFLNSSNQYKLKRSVDHVILQKKTDEGWILHLIEMKSQVDNKRWYEIRQKVRASYFNVCALERVLGIHIESVLVYTTYERTRFTGISSSPDIKTFALPLGKYVAPMPKEDWENHQISVDVGEFVKFKHKAVKMKRNSSESGLVGELELD